MDALEKCPVCPAAVGRYAWSDYWRCDNGHVTYRGREATEGLYVIREDVPERPESYRVEQEENDAGDSFYGVFNRMTGDAWYDRAQDWYAWPLSRSRAESLLRRLNEPC